MAEALFIFHLDTNSLNFNPPYTFSSSVLLFSCSVVSDSLWPHGQKHQASLSITSSQSLLKPMSTELVMASSKHILSSSSPPAFNIVQHQSLFQWVGSSRQVAKVLEFQLQHQSFQWYSGLISFRMDWFDLAVQGTVKNLLQHHSSKASILWCSDFLMVQLSHPYMTTGETIALTRWTFVGKVMSLLFNMFSRLVIIFLPRSKRLLISWLQSPSTVILEPNKIKSVTVSTISTVSPSISMKWWDQMPWS